MKFDPRFCRVKPQPFGTAAYDGLGLGSVRRGGGSHTGRAEPYKPESVVRAVVRIAELGRNVPA